MANDEHDILLDNDQNNILINTDDVVLSNENAEASNNQTAVNRIQVRVPPFW